VKQHQIQLFMICRQKSGRAIWALVQDVYFVRGNGDQGWFNAGLQLFF